MLVILSEEWTPNSITSTYRVLHKNGRPIIASELSHIMRCTKSRGLGWRFGFACNKDTLELDIYFDPHVTNIELKKLMVTVTLRAEGSGITDFFRQEEATYSLSKPTRKPLISLPPSDVVKYPVLTFVVTSPLVDLEMPISKRVNNALSNSLRTGAFIDTRFLVFSRRLSSSTVGHALPLFANINMLKAKSSCLYDRLSEDFTACGGISMDEYGYESDSDLDDLDAEEAMRSMSIGSNENRSGNHSDVQGQSSSEPVHFQSIGKTFFIRNFAFATWQALIYYAYTGEVTFLPLRSEHSESHVEIGTEKTSSSCAPPCSPKSMYRLADKLDIHDLRALAFDAICSRLSEANLVDETFSRFTARYLMIRDMEIALLCKHYHSPEVIGAFARKMEGVAEGKLPHCSKTLISLFNQLEPCDEEDSAVSDV